MHVFQNSSENYDLIIYMINPHSENFSVRIVASFLHANYNFTAAGEDI